MASNPTQTDLAAASLGPQADEIAAAADRLIGDPYSAAARSGSRADDIGRAVSQLLGAASISGKSLYVLQRVINVADTAGKIVAAMRAVALDDVIVTANAEALNARLKDEIRTLHAALADPHHTPKTSAASDAARLGAAADALVASAERLVAAGPSQDQLTEVSRAASQLLIESTRYRQGSEQAEAVNLAMNAADTAGKVIASVRGASPYAPRFVVELKIDVRALYSLIKTTTPDPSAAFEAATEVPPTPPTMATAATPATPAIPATPATAAPATTTPATAIPATPVTATPATPATETATATPATELPDPIGDALRRDLADGAWYSLTAVERARAAGPAAEPDPAAYVVAGRAGAKPLAEATALAELAKAAPYLDALLRLGYVVAGGAVAAAVLGHPIADVDLWRAAPDAAEVEAALVAAGLKFRRFEGARHTTWAFAPRTSGRLPHLPPLQLIRVDFGAAECFRYFDIAIAKIAAVYDPATSAPRVVMSADAARALATGVCPVDLARASPAFGRRLEKYSRRIRFAIRKRAGMYEKRFRITAGTTLHIGGDGKRSCFVVRHERGDAAREEARASGYGATVSYNYIASNDQSIEGVNLRSLKRGAAEFLTRYDGWDQFKNTAEFIAHRAAESSFAMARALLDDAAYADLLAAAARTPRDAAALLPVVADVIRAFAARRLAEMPPAPSVDELFARAPIDADAFYIPLRR